MYDRDLLVPTLSNFTRTILRPYDINAVLEDLIESATRVRCLADSGESLVHEGQLLYAPHPQPPETSYTKPQYLPARGVAEGVVNLALTIDNGQAFPNPEPGRPRRPESEDRMKLCRDRNQGSVDSW